MPDSFFQSDKKRKRSSTKQTKAPYQKPFRPTLYGKGQKQSRKDEDLSDEPGDIDGMDFRKGRNEDDMSDEEFMDVNETAAEKRVRLAKGYLEKVRGEVEAAQGDGDYDAADIDRELIASRLQQDVAEAEGKIHLYLGKHITSHSTKFITTPSHRPTSITVTPQAMYISTKRGSIFPYPLSTLKRGTPFPTSSGGHKGEILAIDASEDGKWLASGGRDKIIGVWDVSGAPRWVAGLKGHKDAVTSVSIPALNNPSHHILTASLSRHLALHSLSTLSLIDTFFGHQDSITSVHSLKPTAAVTSGSRDRTCRWWRVEEEIQLVFRGGGRTFLADTPAGGAGLQTSGAEGTILEDESKERLGGGWFEGEEPVVKSRAKGKEFVEGSIDCVCMLDDQHFVSGGDSGSISLWHTGKKKPTFTKPFSHGLEDALGDQTPRWLTSLSALRGTDLFASGSWDGVINLWAIDNNFRSFSLVSTINIAGFINSIRLISLPSSTINSTSWTSSIPETTSDDEITTAKNEIYLVAAVGQEPRLGRWQRDKSAKNGALLVKFELDSVGSSLL